MKYIRTKTVEDFTIKLELEADSAVEIEALLRIKVEDE